MKNLKKVLSLALVFAMVLGLCIGAMAADTQDVTKLTDWDDVTHKEAATLLNAFNIMQGYPSGTFQPERLVTRAEAVKMLDVALWGGVDQADLFTGSGSSSFPDVKPNDWFAGHVIYAEAYGMLDGNPDGTLRPNANVTGYQMLKMALIALNYSSEAEGLTGAGWDIRTMRLATDPTVKNLTDGLDEIKNWNDPLTRDQAAQIIYNMIDHKTVKYGLTENNQGGYVKTFGESFGTMYLGMVIKHGVIAANDYGMVNTFAGKTSVWDTNKSGKADATKGQNTIIRLKDETTGALQADAATAYVICSTDSGLSDIGANATLYYKDKGNTLLSVAIDTPVEMTPATDGSNVATEKTTVTAGSNGHDVSKYYDTNGDGKIDLVNTISYATSEKPITVTDVIESETFGTVYALNGATWRTTYEKRNNLPSGFIGDVTFADGNAAVKGDVIAYAKTVDATNSDIIVAAVLDSTDGKVDRIVTGAKTDDTYYIDGAAHTGLKGVTTFGATGTFYFYPDGYISNVVGEAAAEDHYAVVYNAGYTTTGASTAIGGGKGTLSVQVAATLDNGDTGIYDVTTIITGKDTKITISELTSDQSDINKVFANDGPLYHVNTTDNKNILVTYTLSADGKSISITPVTTTPMSGNHTAATGSAKFGDKYFTSKTVSFISNKAADSTEAWTVYVGIPTFGYTAKTAEYVLDDLYTSDDEITAMLVSDHDLTNAPTTAFVYVFKNNGQVGIHTDGTSAVYELSVYDANSGTVGTIQSITNANTGEFYPSYNSATKSLGNKIADMGEQGFVTGCSDGVIVLSKLAATDTTPTTTPYTYDATNTKFYVIDGENSGAITVADVELQTPDGYDDEGKYSQNYYQAIVKVSSGAATQVILFADRQEIAE